MLSIEALLEDRVTIHVRYLAHTLEVTYRPSGFTTEMVNGVISGKSHGEIIEQLVESWDLTEDGEPIGTDRETVERIVPVPVQRAVTDALLRELRGATDPEV